MNRNIKYYGEKTQFKSDTARAAQLKSAAARKANTRRKKILEAHFHYVIALQQLEDAAAELRALGIDPYTVTEDYLSEEE